VRLSYGASTGLNYFFAALALMSTMIGGGISGLPYAYFNTGLSLGMIVHAFMMIQTSGSCYLYFQTKDLLNGL
jgi:amino acid permease